AGDAGLKSRAESVGTRTYELSQLLTDVLGITDAAAELGSWFPTSVTYHPSCHGMRLLRLQDRQLDLLRTVEGITVADLPEADQCCGFGGTFSMKNAEVSSAMLEDKAENITSTGASLCTGGDASCLLHIGGGLSRSGAAAGTLHFAEILASTRENPYDAGTGHGAKAKVAR
ncbi:MAG: (Fe-S)-binding protein, partial [Micrococcaceae bacterium]|nr:(Fe-S)-binding protein [Micrococcaceae bacterium]